MTNNSDKMKYHECGVFVSVAYFELIQQTGEFNVAFTHFQNLENIILYILKEKLHVFYLASLE